MSRPWPAFGCRSPFVLIAVGLLLATAPAARGDDASSATDPAGDCTASPCADLLTASTTVASRPPRGGPLWTARTPAGTGALVLNFEARSQWGAGSPPLPEPQVWIW